MTKKQVKKVKKKVEGKDEKCPFKQEKTSFYKWDVNDNKEIDYCRAFRIECVGEDKCPILKRNK